MSSVRSSSAIQRIKQQVYVDVPISPYPLSRYSTLNNSAQLHAPTDKLKENAPLSHSHANIPRSPSDTKIMKRKIFERESAAANITSAKKQKLTTATPFKPKQPVVTTNPSTNASPEFPNGFIYCHQCSRKRDVADAIHCTLIETTGKHKGKDAGPRRCTVKFCRPCLKNRYGEDIDGIKSQGVEKTEKGHIENADYTFQCPRCRDICNCARCRKSKGLEPTGNLTNIARKAGGSAAQLLIDNPKTLGILPGKGTQVEKISKPKDAAKSTNPPAVPTKTLPSKELKTKKLPLLNWTAISTSLDQEEAHARFQIREFVLRFAAVMEPTIPKYQLAELEDVGGSGSRDDESEMAKWVSEACVRTLIIGLLDMLSYKDNVSIEQPIKAAIRDIRAGGVNLNKIWTVLSNLRDEINAESTSEDASLSFPNPSPPSESSLANVRTTRSARESTGANGPVLILHPAQMIPVIGALVEATLETSVVREELDSGVKEGKELTREVNKSVKAENERWDVERKALEASLKDKAKDKAYTREMKAKRDSHKRRVQNLENALKLVLPSLAPRFSSLGTDSDGRVFWALPPGARESKVALDFITSATSGSKGLTARGLERMLEEDKRSAMKDWSWRVVVWGKPPVGSILSGLRKNSDSDVDDGSEDEDADEERWWELSEPAEIRKVADWIAVKAGIMSDDDVEGSPAAPLIKGLNEYATLLEWRLRENKYEPAGEQK